MYSAGVQEREPDGCDLYVGMNALNATAFARTKRDVNGMVRRRSD
jgi:hypothetical protein